MKRVFQIKSFLLLTLVLGLVTVSCESDELQDSALENVDNELSLSVSEDSLELDERFVTNELSFNWSTGTNRGTGAAIAYTLEVDLVGNDFSDPLLAPVEAEKGRYSYTIDHGTLNHRLLEQGLDSDQTYELQARLIAEVAAEGVENQIAYTDFEVLTFKPVSSTLYLLGDATPNGWDVTQASQFTASTTQRGVFVWEGPLTEGNFKFTVSRDECLCQDFYTRDSNDDAAIIYNEGGSGEDLQWTVTEADNYRLTVDLINKTFSMEVAEGTVFSQLFIVGDATESGWDIESPAAFTQDSEDPFVFTYEGNLNPGNFKILAGETGDFCGEWYRPLVDGQGLENTTVDQRAGCEPDFNWTVTEETAGRYEIELHTGTNTIKFRKINLYIVGDASPSGWDINSPVALTYENGEFVFNGDLGAENPTGEFKFSNQVGDWCGDKWVNSANPSQSITNSDFIITNGCEGPDNKWKLQAGEAGSYEIRINLDSQTMSIARL